MNPTQDSKQLLTAVIKKQIIILGPDITLAKARNVPGLVVADDGTVTDLSGDPQQITQKLIDQFVQLSGEIVRKTMEPLLNANQTPTPPPPTVTSQPVQTPPTVPTQTTPTETAPPPTAPAPPTNEQTPIAPETLAEQAKSVQ